MMPFMTKYHIAGLFYAKKKSLKWNLKDVRDTLNNNLCVYRLNGSDLVHTWTQGCALSNLVKFGDNKTFFTLNKL